MKQLVIAKLKPKENLIANTKNEVKTNKKMYEAASACKN